MWTKRLGASTGIVAIVVAAAWADHKDDETARSFMDCLTGPKQTPPLHKVGPCRTSFDYDEDGDVDLFDFAEHQVLAFGGGD